VGAVNAIYRLRLAL